MGMLEKAPGLFVWALGTIAWMLATAFLVLVARGLANWLWLCWRLRDVPKTKPQKSSLLLLDLYKHMSSMGPNVDVKVKAFRYLKGFFKSVEDQDVTVAFYGPFPVLLAATPQVAEAILGDLHNTTRAFFYDMLKPWMGEGIVTLNGKPWKARRKAMTPSFHFRILDDYTPIMDKRAKRLVQKLATMSGEYFDVFPVLRAASCGVLFETMMGVDYDEDDSKIAGYLKIHDALCESFAKRLTNFHHWFDCIYAFTKDRKEMLKHVEEARDFVSDVFQKRITEYRKGFRDPVSRNSLLELLFRMCVDEGTLSETEVRDEILSAQEGGFDFTATNLAFALYLIGHHPEIQDKLRDEIDAAFGDDWEKPLDPEAVKGLTYMDCVLREALRLYPPAQLVGRLVTRDTKIGNHVIPRGTLAIIALYFLHRHPRYIKDPDCFIPERFMGAKSMPTFAHVPFSAGPRNCLGQKFALREQKIILTHILRRFNVSSKVPMDKLELAMSIVLYPVQGIELKFTPRTLLSSS
ncbi:cytochrome P450 4V2-like [Dermacentor albipictus]|uniref:cytochrome P450 4V2-like n=1 Tax=Dermacentor albipictus TaxID=60249 RepID=UPI0031FC95C6